MLRLFLAHFLPKGGKLDTETDGLRGGKVPVGYRLRAGNIDGTFLREESEEVAQPHGRRGLHASAPPLSANELADRELDVGKLNIEWVDHTEDPLFRDLSRNERYRFIYPRLNQ